MLRLFRRIETLFGIPYREILHVDPRLFLTLLADPEAAVIRVIFEAEAVVGVEAGERIVGIEEGTVILISGIEGKLPIGMIAVVSASVPTGATGIETALEGVVPLPVRGRHSEGIFETRETRAMVLSG